MSASEYVALDSCMPIGAIWRAPESLCRAHLTTLFIACTTQTHCLSSALDERIACRVHSTNAPLSYRVHSTDAPLSSRVHLTYALLVECIRDRQCAIVERDRQTTSALDRRTVLFWSAIVNRRVLTSSGSASESSQNQRCIASVRQWRLNTMPRDRSGRCEGMPQLQGASKHIRHKAPPARVSISASWHVRSHRVQWSLAPPMIIKRMLPDGKQYLLGESKVHQWTRRHTHVSPSPGAYSRLRKSSKVRRSYH